VVEGDDLHGDGVNISARLEGLADPGGIFISGTAFDQIHKNVDVGYEFLGEQQVKNIAEPVRVYRVLTDPEDAGKLIGVTKKSPVPWKLLATVASIVVLAAVAVSFAWLRPWQPSVEPASIDQMAFPLPDKPSIAVLPFNNLSDDTGQEYFAQGLTDDLITDLSKISGLFVIARNSSFAYKGQQVKIRRVAEDLGVRYILEGSVRRAGDQVRINAQLIDATSGGHLWAERYDGTMQDIFALQDSVIVRIVSALAVELTSSDQNRRAASRENVNLEAYDYLLRGRQLLSQIERQETEKAKGMFEMALKIDPKYARAYLNLGLLHLYEWSLWGRGRDQNLARAIELGQKAAEFDPDLSGAYALVASAYQYLGEHDKAEVAGGKAIALNPTHSETLAILGAYLARAGPVDKAIEVLTKAMRLDPYLPPRYIFHLGWAYFGARQYEQAIEVLRSGVTREPNYIAFHLWLAASYAMLGRKAEAKVEVSEVLRLNPNFTLTAYAVWARNYSPKKYKADLKRRLTALREAGIPE
jgi:TolB-like protein/cytochrome c-type biogenesis protein CcmH/NrfG